MTDHLPECKTLRDRRGEDYCYCPDFYACEQRVRSDAIIYLSESFVADGGYAEGYADALREAREAVERASSLLQPLGPALAAIDALLENN